MGRRALLLPALGVLATALVVALAPTVAEAQNGFTVAEMVGPAGSERFGASVVVLSNGNYAISDPYFDGPGLHDIGAVYLYDGATNQLVSRLTGALADDRVGSGGLTPVGDGNLVVSSPSLSIGADVSVGAVTWIDSRAGLQGSVSSANSLVGSTTGDSVGGGEIVRLSNGNYVVASPSWSNGQFVSTVGAVTWGSGVVGVRGAVSAANSQIGAVPFARAGKDRIVPLTNGNYVSVNTSMPVGTHSNAGAITWGNGTTGSTGTISASNSFVGDHDNDNDQLGGDGVVALPNGNYVLVSSKYDAGGVVDTGAATWGNGSTGVATSIVGSSLYGTIANDQIGLGKVIVLANGNYVVSSTDRPNGGAQFAGAVGERTTAKAIFVARPAENIVTRIDDIDTAPPVFTATPSSITAATAPGATTAVVTFATPTAIDNILPPTVSCSPASGSALPVGVTTVTCTATDRAGLHATTTFAVTVTATPATDGDGGGGGGSTSVTDYVPLVPARLVDTRPEQHTTDNILAGGGLQLGGITLTMPVAGWGGVAADALAAALNVTAVEPAANAFVTVFPCGSTRPTASNLNVDAGAVAPNTVLAKIGTGGAVCVYVSQTMHLVVDVNGYFPASSTYAPANPQRVLDSRPGELTADTQQQGGGIIPAGTTTELQISGRVGVPDGTSSVALNVTVTGAQGPGFVTVYPCGAGRPTASSLNASGSDVANLVVASLGANGKVCLFNQTAMHLVADVNGWFPAATAYAPLTPDRLLDTRLAGGARVATDSVTVLRVAGVRTVPAAVGTVVLNVTVTDPAGNGFVTVYPCGVDRPLASNLNFVAGQTVPNAVIVKVGTNGSVCVYSSQATHLVVDANGTFPS
jgi:trimeric autotransporter adhesin